MPIKNVQDAIEVREHIGEVFRADRPDERAQAIRRLFVNVLDFEEQRGQVALASTPAVVKLPQFAERIAVLDGVHVCYVALDISDSERVRKQEAVAATRQLANELGDDLLLVFTNTSGSQLHLVHPLFETAQPTLRRMVVERDLPRRTAIQQIANIYSNYLDSGSIRDALDSAFDVEPVTKRFFQEYKRVFENAENLIIESNGDQTADWRMFVQTLFNRLMFIHFLSRKGWLTFDDDTDYLNTDYLNALWRSYQSRPDETSFYRDRLRPLFFCGLNNPNRPDGYMNSVFGDPPFLNGGLFERIDLDQRTQIEVPDEVIRPVLQELFDRFNFTVMESTPFDIEVAVDPEMLGKVFEELVTGRHESGAYYTPRPVVAFMCREALKGHLESCGAGLDADAVQKFVDRRDTHGISVSAAPAISKALDEISVVDPACGSGAYLLGMLQELIDLQTALYNVRADSRSLYELKLHIIERNLYGVDVEPFAINIAMLRLWLSLAIEYEGEKPEPLPNLDFKIVCGDSLLGPNPSLLDQSRYQIEISDLPSLKTRYMRETVQKDDLRREIVAAEEKLRVDLGVTAVPAGVIDWRIEFAEVVTARGGFDVVLANPPYVRMEKLNKSDEDRYKANFRVVAASRADLLVYFYARAVELLKDGGTLALITSNKYMRAGYGKKLRAFLTTTLAITQVIDFGDLPVFTATSYPAVLVGRKGASGGHHQLQIADLAVPVRRELSDRGIRVTPETMNREMEHLSGFLRSHGHTDYSQSFFRPTGWVLEDPHLIRLFERLMNQGKPLGEFVNGRIYRGVVTGLNEAFVINQAKRDTLVATDPMSAEIIKPWLRGRDIRRWTPDWARLYIVFTNRGVDIDRYPVIREHLEWFRPQLEQRATAHLHPWYELQQPQEGIYAEFERPKVIWPDIAREARFAYDIEEGYLDATCFTVPSDSQWLLAILNSLISEFVLSQNTSSIRGGFLRPKRQYMLSFPVVSPDSTLRHSLESVAQAGVDGEVVNSDELNALVYDLYGLSRSDVKLINDWFERRSLAS